MSRLEHQEKVLKGVCNSRVHFWVARYVELFAVVMRSKNLASFSAIQRYCTSGLTSPKTTASAENVNSDETVKKLICWNSNLSIKWYCLLLFIDCYMFVFAERQQIAKR